MNSLQMEQKGPPKAASDSTTNQKQQAPANPASPPGQMPNGFETPVNNAPGRTLHPKQILTVNQKGSPLKAAIVGTSVVPVPVMQGIRVLIEEKERELMGLSERRVRAADAQAKSLAEDLRKKEAETAILHSQLAQLTSDFNYNLKLLDERDAELEKQDQELAGFKTSLRELELAAAEFRREGERWREEDEKRQRRVEELEKAVSSYQEVVAKVRGQLEDAKQMRDEEIAKQASEAVVLKTHLAELSAQHETESASAVQRAEKGFQTERNGLKKRLAELENELTECQAEVAKTAERERNQTQGFQRELEGLREGVRAELNERVAEEREKGRREVEVLRQRIDGMSVNERNAEARHTAELDLLERKMGAEYQAALLTLQEKHGDDVSMRERARQQEREAAEEARLTLAARLESAEREARGAGVKWEERVRALQDERKHGDQRGLALQARVAELEELTLSQAHELESLTSAHVQEAESTRQQTGMLQALVDDLHVALQRKEGEARDLQKRLDELENAKASAVAAAERDRAEAESALRQQLLADYESKVGELLDTLRTMKEHVASENDEAVRKLDEETELHRKETEELRGNLEDSEHKWADLEIAYGALREESAREKEDAQFVRSTLAARDAEVHLLRSEVEAIQKEVKGLSHERATWQRTEDLQTEKKRTKDMRTEQVQTEMLRREKLPAERSWTEEVAGIKTELTAREAEVARLSGMLAAQGLGFGGAKGGEVGAAARFGVSGSADSALLRKLAAENEELPRRLATAQHPEGLAAGLEVEREADSTLFGLRKDGLWASPNDTNRTGAAGRRVGDGLGWDMVENPGFKVQDFGKESGLRSGGRSPNASPAVAKLYDEMKAVRRSVEALRSGHVAAGEGATSDRGHVAVANGKVTEGLQSEVLGVGRPRGGQSGLESGLESGSNSTFQSGLLNRLESGFVSDNQVMALRAELSAIRKEILVVEEDREAASDRRRNLGLGSLAEEKCGLGSLLDELSELNSLVRDLASQRERGEGQSRPQEGTGRVPCHTDKYVGDNERKPGVSMVAGNGRELGELQGVIASIRAELESLRRAKAHELVTWQGNGAHDVNPRVTSKVSAGFVSTQLGDSADGFRSPKTGEKYKIIPGRARNAPETVRNASERDLRVTSASDVAADVEALWETISKLTQELSVLRSEAAHGPDSRFDERFRLLSGGLLGGKGKPSSADCGPFGKHAMNDSGRPAGSVAGVHAKRRETGKFERNTVQTERKTAETERNTGGTERSRPESASLTLAPSALLQREIADVRAELVAFRNANSSPERKWAERNGCYLDGMERNDMQTESREARGSGVQWADETNRGLHRQVRDGYSKQMETIENVRESRTVLGEGFESGRGLPRPPLLTWTDLANCLEQSENEPGAGRFSSAHGSENVTGHVDALLQRVSTAPVHPSRAAGALTKSGVGCKQGLISSVRSAGPPSGAVSTKSMKSGAKALPRLPVKGSVKEKQNKVNHTSKPNWSTSAPVFQVAKK